jgi:hypothetical protein
MNMMPNARRAPMTLPKRNAIATLRQQIGEIRHVAAFTARTDPEQADLIRADAEVLQEAIKVLERR